MLNPKFCLFGVILKHYKITIKKSSLYLNISALKNSHKFGLLLYYTR